jgi:hypothetical protein
MAVRGAVKEQQYQLLGLSQVAFTANPPQVRPFGTTTLSWEVKPPSTLHVPVTLVVGGQPVQGLSGSASFTLDRTTEFGLTARTALVSRVIRALTVMVNASECRVSSFPAFILANTVKQAVDQQLQGRLRGDGSTVTPGDGILSIAIPLNLNGQGTMDISMELWVQVADPTRTGGAVVVTAHNVIVNVDLSGVLSSLCEGAVSQTAQAFMTEIADNQVAPGVAKGLIDQVQQLATSAQAGDNPQHRPFALTSLVLTRDEITFTLCPKGLGLGGGGGSNFPDA